MPKIPFLFVGDVTFIPSVILDNQNLNWKNTNFWGAVLYCHQFHHQHFPKLEPCVKLGIKPILTLALQWNISACGKHGLIYIMVMLQVVWTLKIITLSSVERWRRLIYCIPPEPLFPPNCFRRSKHDMVHGKWGVILNVVNTDDTLGNSLPKCDLVMNELKCVVVPRSMCKSSQYLHWSGHEDRNGFPRWPCEHLLGHLAS